jgi:hypothetical protein
VVIMAAKEITFSPAIPNSFVFDVQGRIQEPRDSLDPKHLLYQPEQQHANIKTLIKLYEDKEIDGIQQVYVMEGKVVTEEETRAVNRLKGVLVWEEVRLLIFIFIFILFLFSNLLL